MESVNYYYDQTEDHELSSDPEGNLVMLCRDHATSLKVAGKVEFASRGDTESECEVAGCSVCNDPFGYRAG